MRVNCLHGYFIFDETSVGQISDFIGLTGLSLVPVKNYFTFEALENAPEFTIEGGNLLGAVAAVTFAGHPWDVFEANEMVYDFTQDLVVPISSIALTASIKPAGNRFVSPGLILPGSVTADGERVKDYSAWFSRTTQRFLYSRVTYV